jgi:hypothetical protein
MSSTHRSRPAECAIKIVASKLSDPIMRRWQADLEERHDPPRDHIERRKLQPEEVSNKRAVAVMKLNQALETAL